MARRTDTGLGTSGIAQRSGDGVQAVLRTRPRRGWQLLREYSFPGAADTALTDMTAAPADAVELPDDGQYLEFRSSGPDAGACTVQLLMFPIEGAGWSETWVFADSDVFATDLSGSIDQALGANVARAIRGVKWIAARITAAGESRQVQYRVF